MEYSARELTHEANLAANTPSISAKKLIVAPPYLFSSTATWSDFPVVAVAVVANMQVLGRLVFIHGRVDIVYREQEDRVVDDPYRSVGLVRRKSPPRFS